MRLIALLLAVMATPASAQEESMDLQRCIWSCLSAFGPNTNPAYHQCVADTCVGGGTSPQPQPTTGDPTQVWQFGQTGNGTRYAGIDLPGMAGEVGVYFFCKRGSPPVFTLVGFDGGAARVIFDVDGQRFPLDFGQDLSAPIPAGSQIAFAIQSGGNLTLRDASGNAMHTLPLTGSKRAMANTITYC